jgi:hypothetical protein
MTIVVRQANSKADKLAFLNVAFSVFRDTPQWVAPLYMERLEHLDPKKNPYFKHADAQLFVAERNGEVVGRISAQVDRLHLERYNDATGQFGFLDAINDRDVFAALVNAAETWLRAKGMTRVRGPFSFSINDETGLLVDGFDTPPSMMMGHAQQYYKTHVEALGFTKVKDVYAYDYDLRAPLTREIERAWRWAKKTTQISVRPLDKKNMAGELDIIMSIFNDAWSANWGFVPFTPDELKLLGTNLKMLVTGNYVAIASYNGEPAAMAITLPNLNEWIAGMNGRLLPLGWAKLLPRVIAKKPRTLRLPLMGVRKAFHDSVTGSALAFSVIMALRDYHLLRGVERIEMSWVLEDNKGMRNILESAGAKPYKTYRVYEKALAV